jgi:hypothetical protein
MANNDESNKSDNSVAPNTLSTRLSDIGKQVAYRIPVEERYRRKRSGLAHETKEELDRLTPEQRAFGPIQRVYKQDIETIRREEPRIRIGVESRLERASQLAMNEIGRTFDEANVSRTIRDMAHTQGVQAQVMMYSGTEHSILQARGATIRSEIGTLRGQAMNLTGDLYTKRGINSTTQTSIANVEAQIKQKIEELAPIETAISRKERLGLDLGSRMTAFEDMGLRAADIERAQSPEIKRLTQMSASDFKKAEIEAATNVTKALNELKLGAEKTGKSFETLEKNAEDANKAMSDVETARRQGGGRGGGGRTGFLADSAEKIFGAVSQGFQQIGVNQRLAQQNNITGYADFQNQIYQTYKAANAGDVASLMALPQFQDAEEFGGKLKTAANISVGAGILSGLSGMAGGVLGGAALGSIVPGVGTLAGGIVGGIAGGIGGAVNATTGITDLYSGISGGQADIAGRQTRMGRVRALQAIGAEQMQGFRDFGVGMGVAAQGMGTGGEAFLRSTVSAAGLDRMATARISPEQMAQMAQMGVNTMGGGFNQEQIYSARALERRGLGSMQQNMERMGQLYMAGANNPQEGLGRILEAAIPKGFDNSKLVGQLVQYSSQMAQSAGGAATGLNLTGASAALLTSGIGPQTANREAMLEHAASVAGGFKNAETNISTSYRGMLNVARMQRAMGRGGIEAIMAGGASVEALMTIEGDLGKDVRNKTRRDALIVQGLNPNTTPSELQKIIRAKQMADLDIGATTLTGVNTSKLLGKIMGTKGGFSSLEETDKLSLSQMAILGVKQGLYAEGTTGEDLFKRERGIGARTTGTGKGVYTDDSVGKLMKSMDDMRSQSFVQLSKAAGNAATELDKIAGAGKGIEVLVAAFKRVENTISNTEKQAPGAATRGMTGDKGFDTKQWDNVAGKLNILLQRMIDNRGGSIPSQKDGMAHQ